MSNTATFQPTFLYELIWNLGLAGALVWLGHHRRIRPGGLFALYVAGYSGFRIFEELLRVDPAHHIFGLRLNLYVAALLFVGALLWFARIQTGAWPWCSVRRGAAVVLVGGALALAGCGQSDRADAATTAHKTPVACGDFCFAREAAVLLLPESSSRVAARAHWITRWP
jgi:Prolipoprotein diacylglyceryl transferase